MLQSGMPLPELKASCRPALTAALGLAIVRPTAAPTRQAHQGTLVLSLAGRPTSPAREGRLIRVPSVAAWFGLSGLPASTRRGLAIAFSTSVASIMGVNLVYPLLPPIMQQL